MDQVEKEMSQFFLKPSLTRTGKRMDDFELSHYSDDFYIYKIILYIYYIYTHNRVYYIFHEVSNTQKEENI